VKQKPVRIRSEAQAEIEEAFEGYRKESREVAGRFLDEIGTSLDLIRLHPSLYPDHRGCPCKAPAWYWKKRLNP